MILKDRNTRDYSAWTIGNGAPIKGLCIHPTQDTSRMGTARVKQEEEADTRIMQESSKKYGRKGRENEGEKSQTRPN